MAQLLPRHGAFLRFAKIKKGSSSALIAARHNLRELPLTPNITAGKQSLNHVLLGARSAEVVQDDYRAALRNAGITQLRKDAVRLIEAIVSLPVGVEDGEHAYFEASLCWLESEFGASNILSAVIHKDEAAQHMHVLITPLVDGHMRGSDLLGGPAHMRARHGRFISVMEPYLGQIERVAEQHQKGKELLAQEVVAMLQRVADPMWESCVAQVIRDCIESNPGPFYAALGFSSTFGGSVIKARKPRVSRAKRMPTMAEIFTRPVKNVGRATAERYRQSDECQRANVVARCRLAAKLGQGTATGSDRQLQNSARFDGLKALAITLITPQQPIRTLCSVGFATSQSLWRIHAAHGSVQRQPVVLWRHDLIKGAALKEVAVSLNIQWRYVPLALAMPLLSFPLRLAEKLLCYWLWQAYPP